MLGKTKNMFKRKKMKETKKTNSLKAILTIKMGIAIVAICAIGCNSFQPAKKESIPVKVSGGNQ